VVDYYRDAGVLLTVDGEQSFDQVRESLLRALGDQLHLDGSAGRR
jgi:adenylate kinase family enzyme